MVGQGTGTASYAATTTGVVALGTGTAGEVAGDVLPAIESLTDGSGNDTLVGESASDTAVYAGSVRDYMATKVGKD